MGRVLIIGLDGATFDLIQPWAEAGRLPGLARLLARSAAGGLRSTVPPMSPPAWSSLMTGRNPGKHGIFDFTERRPDSYEIGFVNSRSRKCDTIWKLLSRAGKRVCVVGVPTTYPVEPLNGVMISGFDTPRMNDQAIHPWGLQDEIRASVGDYIFSSGIMGSVAAGKVDAAVDLLLHSLRRRADVARYLWTREPWDCFMVVFGETDNVAHYFWKDHDPRSPHHAGRASGSRYPDPILTVYEHVDRVVEEFLDLATGDTVVMVVSDHGAGGTSDKAIHVNRWLESEGLLAFRTRGAGGLAWSLLERARWWVRRLPPGLRKNLPGLRGTAGARAAAALRFSGIDWDRTQAYSEETPYYPSIRVNLRGREPRGTVAPGSEYESVRARLVDRLQAWRDPETGQPVVERVWRREEVYRGPWVSKAPDLIVSWGLDRGYAYLSRPSHAPDGRRPISRLDGRDPRARRFLVRQSGSHREIGVVILSGGPIVPGVRLTGAEITDIAPTVLHLCDVPIPADMDGRVLAEALDPGLLQRRPARYDGGERGREPTDAEEGYSEQERDLVRQRLQDLGYLE